MKRLLIICIAVTMYTCKEEPKIDYALFSGKVENPADKVITVYDGREKVKEMALRKDGTFADTLTIESGYYRLSHDKESSSIYLSPGDNINVTLNFEEFDESLTYSGNGAGNSNYLARKYLVEEKANFDVAKIFALEENEFISKLDERKASKMKLLKEAKDVTKDFRALEEKNIEYDYLSNLQNYQSYHSYFSKKEDFMPSDNFMNLIETVDYNNEEDYDKLNSYKRLTQSYYSNKISNSDNPSEIFRTLNTKAFPDLKKDLANSLIYNISPNNMYNEAYYNGLMNMSSDEKYKEKLKAKYDKVMKLAKGMLSPKFVKYENHKGGTTSLEDLRGKYVYIDVWATWCGPCIREIPSLKEVEILFHDKNIAFVSTSIDKAEKHKEWVEMVEEKELGGIQLIADKDWNSQFVQDYAIEGIPRFILIDPDGNIVDADAPRPSDPKLIEMFKELKI
ncbi:TlpA family protein disulfide reductase [Winogradskyella luteola]|uniref:TlpA family protein disulfide reductase n=1 Tax=Winogradskyella luteola TaxID=2828330 RepID=A0A9X1F658_9FLAO|nr:TlpA disulfide reductase family protein [Winogradskyella luteola]MBV7268096.1 TlpA family protein disulfide reductase [Winogradskyella luteola]